MYLFLKLAVRLGWLKEPVIHFNNGPCLENPRGNPPVTVRFLHNGACDYETTIGPGEWARASKKYLAHWTIHYQYLGIVSGRHDFDLQHNQIRINIDSRSLGDTLAWIGQISTFKAMLPKTRVFVSHFWPSLEMAENYPELEFISPEQELENCYAVYNLGFYFENVQNHHPVDPRTVPLGKVASDILGIPYRETRPLLPVLTAPPATGWPTVCIATTSTANCKHWLYPQGWQVIVDWLNTKGFSTVVIQKEPTKLADVIDETGDKPILERVAQLERCEFFIGLGSGLSWLAWALGKPVVLISGFSDTFAEFQSRCYRVINRSVCHGCWNDTNYTFERDNWDWCPRQQDSARRFQCSNTISPAMVRDKILELVNAEDIKIPDCPDHHAQTLLPA